MSAASDVALAGWCRPCLMLDAAQNADHRLACRDQRDARYRRRGGEGGPVGVAAIRARRDRDHRCRGGGHDDRGANQHAPPRARATVAACLRGWCGPPVEALWRRDRQSRADRFVDCSARRRGPRPPLACLPAARPSAALLPCAWSALPVEAVVLAAEMEQRRPAHLQQPAHGCDDLRGRTRTRRGGRGRRGSGQGAEAQSAAAQIPRDANRGQRAPRPVAALAGRPEERYGGP